MAQRFETEASIDLARLQQSAALRHEREQEVGGI